MRITRSACDPDDKDRSYEDERRSPPRSQRHVVTVVLPALSIWQVSILIVSSSEPTDVLKLAAFASKHAHVGLPEHAAGGDTHWWLEQLSPQLMA
jgi:hypothetical protein